MESVIELKPTWLIAAPIENDAIHLRLQLKKTPKGQYCITYLTQAWIEYTINLPFNRWKILGTVTKSEIDFDPGIYLEQRKIITLSNAYSGIKIPVFKNYNSVEKDICPMPLNEFITFFENSTNSFYSLLALNDLFWINPDSKPSFVDANFQPYTKPEFLKLLVEYYRKESIVYKMQGKKLLILTPIN